MVKSPTKTKSSTKAKPKAKVKVKATVKSKAAKVVKKSVKSVSSKVEKLKPEEEKEKKPGRYYEAVGRRKRATARVRIFTRGEKEFSVNSKPYIEYFPTEELQQLAGGSLKKMKVVDKFKVSAIVKGGGSSGQAEAVRHGIARALLKFNPDFRKRLKRALRRDPREKERKKFGLKGARRAPQWSKR